MKVYKEGDGTMGCIEEKQGWRRKTRSYGERTISIDQNTTLLRYSLSFT